MTAVERAIASNPKMAKEFRKGSTTARTFLIGQIIKFSRGTINPQLASDALKKKLGVIFNKI